jgi:hypothetical protein
MKNKYILSEIYKNAIEYHKNLEGKNVLFAYGSQTHTDFIETLFLSKHFLHLTGVKLVNGMGAKLFYKRCLHNQISPKDFQVDSTVKLKLDVLPQVMKIYRNAKMCGDFDGNRLKPRTEKIIGNITVSLGFIKDGDYYVPNTVLEEDIRNVTIHPQQRVLAVFRKSVKQEKYTELCYTARGITRETLILPNKIAVKLAAPGLGTAMLHQKPKPEKGMIGPEKLSDRIIQARQQAQKCNAKCDKLLTQNRTELER